MNYYKDAPDINISAREEKRGDRNDRGDRRDRRDKGDRRDNNRGRSNTQFSRFFINVGKANKINATNIIGLINEKTRLRDIEIGKIDMLKSFSFFEVDASYEKNILEAFKDASMGGTKLVVELSKEKKQFNKSFSEKGDNKYKRNKKTFDSKSNKKSKKQKKY